MKVKTKLCATALAVALGVGLLAGCQMPSSGSNSGNPSGGADSTSQAEETKYLVNVSQSSEYTVAGLNAEGYAAGAKVSFTVSPASGKELVSVGYDQVDITPKADGSYEFNMPEKNVTLIISVRSIAQYELSYTGTLQVDAGPVTFSLKLGTDPVPGVVLEEIAGKDLVDIDGVEVTGKEAGTTTIIAKVNGEEKARKEVTVAASELVSIKNALDAAVVEAPFNGKAGNNSAKTTSNYTIAGQVIAMSNYDDSGAMSVVIDDGTAAALLIIYSSSKAAPEYAVGDSIKTTCKFTNYYGVLEGIGTTSTATKQNSLYPDQLVKVEKTFTPSLANATNMTGAQYLEYVTLANANQSATAGAWTPLKRVNIAVTYDKDHAMSNKDEEKGGYVIDGATEYAINGAELSRITLDAGNGHKSTLSGILTGVNTNYKTSKIFADHQYPLAVKTIEFTDGDSKTIFLNNPVELEYTLSPEGSYGEATWTSSEPTKVSVENGVITGLEAGTSTITLTINGVSKSINVTVSGEQHVCESITLNKNTLPLYVGGTETLVATVAPDNCTDTVSWETSNKDVATVDQEGKITAVAAGNATITVKCGAKSDTCAVTVTIRHGTVETDPLTVDEAKAIGLAEATVAGSSGSNYTADFFYVKGYVDGITSNDGSLLGTMEGMSIRYLRYDEGLTASDVKLGSVIVAYGQICNYNNGTIQLSHSNAFKVFIKSIDNTKASFIGCSVKSLNAVVGGDDVDSPFAVYPEALGLSSQIQLASSNTEVATIVNGKIHPVGAGNTEITATYGTLKPATVAINVAPEGQQLLPVHTLDGTVSGKDNSYAGSEDIVMDGITWNVTGNTQQNPWRLGGKNLDNVARSIYSKTAITQDVKKIEIEVGTANITVNSINVGVYSTAEKAAAGGEGDVANFTPEFVASSTIELTKTDETSWANCFYNITFKVTAGKDNKYVQFVSAVFYA